MTEVGGVDMTGVGGVDMTGVGGVDMTEVDGLVADCVYSNSNYTYVGVSPPPPPPPLLLPPPPLPLSRLHTALLAPLNTPQSTPLLQQHPSCLMCWWQWRHIWGRRWTSSLKQCGEGIGGEVVPSSPY